MDLCQVDHSTGPFSGLIPIQPLANVSPRTCSAEQIVEAMCCKECGSCAPCLLWVQYIVDYTNVRLFRLIIRLDCKLSCDWVTYHLFNCKGSYKPSVGPWASVCHPSFCSVSCTAGCCQFLLMPFWMIQHVESRSRHLVRAVTLWLFPYRNKNLAASVLPLDY